jgi:hypothetical protein
MSDELEVRFERLTRDGRADWSDVLNRVGKRHRSRRMAVAACLAALVAVLAPTALALHGTALDFFSSEPAPNSLVVRFERLDAGAPPGLENDVVYGETRKIFERRSQGHVWTLWVAPNRKGGYCTALVQRGREGGFGCVWAERPPLSSGLGIAAMKRDGTVIHGPFILSGSVGIDNAERIEIRYEDGEVESQALTWVSKPIGAGFYLFDIGRSHWSRGTWPDRIVVRDGSGTSLFEEPVRMPGPVPQR